MKKCIETLQKQTIGVIFNIQNSRLLTWSLPTEEISQAHSHNQPVANLPGRSLFSATINAIT